MDLRDYKALSPHFKNEESEVSHSVHGWAEFFDT